jgi:hypothetical protein
MQTYYRIFLEVGRKKKEKYNRTIHVRTGSTNPIEDVFNVVRKIRYAKMIAANKIDKETYLRAVSTSVS